MRPETHSSFTTVLGMSETIESTDELVAKVNAQLDKADRLLLSGDKELTQLFQQATSNSKNTHSAYVALMAVAAFCLLSLLKYFSGETHSPADIFYLSGATLTVALPVLGFAIISRLNVSFHLRQWMMAGVYTFATLADVSISLRLAADDATYIAFASVLIIITCIIVLPISFRTALASSVLNTAILCIATIETPLIPTAVAVNTAGLYLTVAGLTLFVNYRQEQQEKINFVNSLREQQNHRNSHARSTKLNASAVRDPLTAMLNRHAFAETVDTAIAEARRREVPLSLVMLDIDQFKQYNDHYGHAAGDDCLVRVANAISRFGTVARMNGEEFALLLLNCSGPHAVDVANSVRLAVRALSLPHDALGANEIVTVSAGVSSLNLVSDDSFATLMQRADRALSRCKDIGRDRVELDEQLSN